VTDDGGLPAGLGTAGIAAAGTGHGIIGMRERVHLCGGTFGAGPLPGGGFEVAAALPLPLPPVRGDHAAAPPTPAWEADAVRVAGAVPAKGAAFPVVPAPDVSAAGAGGGPDIAGTAEDHGTSDANGTSDAAREPVSAATRGAGAARGTGVAWPGGPAGAARGGSGE
jgi:hypothetical protein